MCSSTLIEIEAMIVDVNTDLVNELGCHLGAQIGTTSLGYGDLGLRPGNGLPVDGAAAELAPGTLGNQCQYPAGGALACVGVGRAGQYPVSAVHPDRRQPLAP